MNINAELEKLIVHRDRGDLSQAEFEKAKTLLLSQESPQPTALPKMDPDSLEAKMKKKSTQLLTGTLASLAALLGIASAIIDPSILKLVLVVIWVVVATLAWVAHAKLKAEIEREEMTGG